MFFYVCMYIFLSDGYAKIIFYQSINIMKKFKAAASQMVHRSNKNKISIKNGKNDTLLLFIYYPPMLQESETEHTIQTITIQTITIQTITIQQLMTECYIHTV